MEQKRMKTAKINRINQPPLQVKLREEVRPEEVMQAVRECESKIEKINHPSHYQGNKFEAIDIIEDFELGFNLGNALKYLLRAGRKNPGCEGFCEDLEKAVWYLKREQGNAESNYERR